MKHTFSTVGQAVDAIARGEVVIVVDAENRENEGDFVCASQMATPAVINFMLHGRGQLCVSVMEETAQRCRLDPVVLHNNAPLSTAFLTPIDHKSTQTGITAAERAATIRALANPASTANDFVRPGHVFPLLAKEGGVLQRAGHTEASMDLARLAGLAPSGVLCEILDDRGERPSREILFNLAHQFKLEIISIAQLAAYRFQREQLVHRAAEVYLPSKHGDLQVIAYDFQYDTRQPVALVMGDVANAAAPLVRLHSSCFADDLMQSLRGACSDQLNMVLEMIGREGVGAVVILPQEGSDTGFASKLRTYGLQDPSRQDIVQGNKAFGLQDDELDYCVAQQVLKDLGMKRMRLLTNSPMKAEAISASGLDVEIIDQVPMLPPVTHLNRRFLRTTQARLGHLLGSEDTW